jgi:hypothetical protein
MDADFSHNQRFRKNRTIAVILRMRWFSYWPRYVMGKCGKLAIESRFDVVFCIGLCANDYGNEKSRCQQDFCYKEKY